LVILHSAAGGWFRRAARPFGLSFGLFVAAFGAGLLHAQPFRVQSVPPATLSAEAKQAFQARVAEAAAALANEPRLKSVPADARQALVEFVAGNILFVVTHEMGRAVITDMELPVLGRQEDAADEFAVLTMLKHGETDVSDRVLIEAAKGWFVDARRDKKAGHPPTYYDQQGLTERRGFRIVCLLVGADPVRFKALSDETELPHERQRTCGWAYDKALSSWDKVLAPHRRAGDQPKQKFDVIYRDAKGGLAAYADMFRALRFLEAVAALAADRFTWRAPLAIEMRSCGAAGARWNKATRTLHICYEMARDLAALYQNLGPDRLRSTPKPVR
jgi:Putative metallopeptidase